MKKIKINTNKIISLIEPLQAVINPSHIVPILQCVNITVKDNVMSVTGDNHEVRCKNSIDVGYDKKMAFCVNFSLFITALKTLKNEDVEIELDNQRINIVHKRGDFEIPIEDFDAFPLDKTEELKLSSSIRSNALRRVLRIANKFVLNEELEPMSNMSIQIGKKTTIRSTNKIALFEETIKGGGDKANLLISGKSSTAIQTLLEDEDKDVELRYNDSCIYFKFGNKEVTAIQQNGDFPLAVFNKILASIKDADEFEVNQKQFMTSLKRVSTLSAGEKIQRISMLFGKKSLDMSCDNIGSSSKVQEQVGVKFSKKIEIGFNSKLLIEVLSVFDKESKYSINTNNCFCIQSKKSKGLIAPMMKV